MMLGRFEVRLSILNRSAELERGELARRVDDVAKRLAADVGWDDELVRELVDIAGSAGAYCPPGKAG